MGPWVCTFCQSVFLCFSFTDNSVSNSFDSMSLGSLLLIFFLLYASIILALLLWGTMLLPHIQDNLSRTLIDIFSTSDRALSRTELVQCGEHG